MGVAVPRYRRSYGRGTFLLVVAEGMAPWLRVFTAFQWTVAGDREKVIDAWRTCVAVQFSAEGMLQVPPPRSMPPVRPAAPVVAVARQSRKRRQSRPPRKALAYCTVHLYPCAGGALRGMVVHRATRGGRREHPPLVNVGGGKLVSVAGGPPVEAQPRQPQGSHRPPGQKPWVGPGPPRRSRGHGH